jgi:putative DNA primase/helicase
MLEAKTKPVQKQALMNALDLSDPAQLLQDFYHLLGNAVLIPIPTGKSEPILAGWQRLTFADTQTRSYQLQLLETIKTGGNFGVLLGPVSGGLATIEIDNEAALSAFLDLNPPLADTLRIRSALGCQLWIRSVTGFFYPNTEAIHVLKDSSGTRYGQWRCGGGSVTAGCAVLWGQYPAGIAYQMVVHAPPLEVKFIELCWLDADRAAADTEPLIENASLAASEQNHASTPGTQLGQAQETQGWEPPQWEKDRDAAKDWLRQSGKRLQASAEAATLVGATPIYSFEEHAEPLFAELLAKFQNALVSFGQFCALEIKPRKRLLGRWMKEGDTGFVYGERGTGKTWLTDLLIAHLTSAKDFDEDWDVPAAVPVVLVDGEMPYDDTKARLSGLGADEEFLHLLHHEVLFERTGLTLNLTDERQQRIVTTLCEQTGGKLLVLDTLSSLFRGMKENDADAWELVNNWLLDLRRRRITTLIVAHAGRNGDHMRGTSRREDDAFWTICVKALTDRVPGARGAHFETEFTKWRNLDSPPLGREWSVVTEPGGIVTWRCDELSFDEKVLALIQAGLRGATEIAEELKAVKSTVSKAAARLEAAKLIERHGNGNRTTYEPRGFRRS